MPCIELYVILFYYIYTSEILPLENNCFLVICTENLKDFNTYRKRQSYFIERSEQPQIKNFKTKSDRRWSNFRF